MGRDRVSSWGDECVLQLDRGSGCTTLCVCVLSHVQLFVTPWTVAHQAPLSMGFSRQEYWSGLPFPSPGDLPDPGIEPASPALAGGLSAISTTWKARKVGHVLNATGLNTSKWLI